MKKWYSDEVLNKALSEGEEYVMRGWTVYQIHYSQAQGIPYLQKLYTKKGGVPLVNRGHYMLAIGEFVNKIVGFELVKA